MSEMKVWSFLMSRLNNAYGTAAVMGNFYIESKIQSAYLQSYYARKLDMTSAEYTAKTDSGEYPANSFIHDSAGYGLAQWTFWDRKRSLLEYAKSKGASVGDFDTQLEFFWQEVQLYKTVFTALKTANSVKEASDIFAKKYEKPYDTSETALRRRAEAGQRYYDMFAGVVADTVLITANNVNLRVGNGKQYLAVDRVQDGEVYPWVATAENGWHAIEFNKRVLWVHPDYSTVRRKTHE